MKKAFLFNVRRLSLLDHHSSVLHSGIYINAGHALTSSNPWVVLNISRITLFTVAETKKRCLFLVFTTIQVSKTRFY